MGKKPKLTAAYLDQLIEEATVDAYGESEQAVGFFTMMEEHLAFPFTTEMLGQEVTVAKVDLTRRDQIIAVCLHGKAAHPDSRPADAQPPAGWSGVDRGVPSLVWRIRSDWQAANFNPRCPDGLIASRCWRIY